MTKKYGFRDFVMAANQLYPHMVLFQIIYSILSVLEQLLLLAFLGIIINTLSEGSRNMVRIVPIIFIFLLLSFVTKIVANFISIQIEKGQQLLNVKAETKMAKKLNTVEYSTHINDNFRKLYSAVKTGFEYTGGFDIFVSNVIANIAKFGITLIVSCGVIVSVLSTSISNGKQTILQELLITILLILPILFSIFFSRKEGKIMDMFFAYNMKFNRTLDYYSEILFKEPKYAKFLKIYDPQNKIINQAETTINEQITQDEEYQLKAVGYGEASGVVTSLVIGVLYCFFSVNVLNGSLLIGTMITSVGYLQMLIGSLGNFFSAWSNRKASFTTMEQYLEFMNFTSANNSTEKKLDFKTPIEQIEFKHVFFKFPAEEEYVLSDINFSIKKGEKVAMVGPNGSGKSTIVKLLLRLYEPSQGKILVNGQDITQFEIQQYQEQFGTVFQDFNLFAWSIKDNIVMENVFDKERLERILKMVGLKRKIASLPKGIETQATRDLDETGIELSGGEKQKVAIARALYREAQFVILDEPTAALDPISEANIFSDFNNLVQDKTALYISHRMSSTKFSQRILVINDGILVAVGTHQQLMGQEGLYYQMYTEQAKYYEETKAKIKS